MIKYNAVRTVLDDLGIKPAVEGEVRNLKRLHLTLSLVYVVFMLVAIVLLAMGHGTQVPAGYVFVTAHGEAVVEASSTTVAEAFVPITSAILGAAHMTMAASRTEDIASVARAGWSPIMSIATSLVNTFVVAHLALVARIASPETILLLMLVALAASIVDQVSGAMTSAKAELFQLLSTDGTRERVNLLLGKSVMIAQVASGVAWLGIWIILLTNASWQSTNGTSVPTYTVPVIVVALAFFLADKAHSIMVLTGRGCTIHSFFRRELTTSLGTLACVVLVSFIGLS